jgi:hypothetical protein
MVPTDDTASARPATPTPLTRTGKAPGRPRKDQVGAQPKPAEDAKHKNRLYAQRAAPLSHRRRGCAMRARFDCGRVRAGMAHARSLGKHIGRPRAKVDVEAVRDLRSQGKSLRVIAKALGVPISRVRRALLRPATPVTDRNEGGQ